MSHFAAASSPASVYAKFGLAKISAFALLCAALMLATPHLALAADSSPEFNRAEVWAAGVDDGSADQVYSSQDNVASTYSSGSSLKPMTFSDEMLYFCKYESSCNYDQGLSSGDGYNAMGYFQFDRRYGLGDFLKAVYNYNPTRYSCLKVIGTKYSWNTNRATRSKGKFTTFGNDLNTAWHAAYKANPTEFSRLQNGWAYTQYYDSSVGVRGSLYAMGIDIDSRPDCIKGLVWGMSNLFGPGGGASYVEDGYYYGVNWFLKNSGVKNSMSDTQFVTTLCNYVIKNVAKRYPSQPEYHQGWQNRYKSEKADCLAYLAASSYNVNNMSVSVSGMVRNQSGSALEASVKVVGQSFTLKKGTDYRVLYNGSTTAPSKAGSYKVTVEGLGSYTGSKSVGTMVIHPAANVSASTAYAMCNVANPCASLGAASDSPGSGTNVGVYQSNGSSGQKWLLTLGSDGYYTITSAANKSLVLDAAKNPPVSGANISAFQSNGGANQKWTLVPSGSSYVITNAANSSLVLDAAGVSPAFGANVSAYSANGGNNQKWNLVVQKSLADASASASGMVRSQSGKALSATVSVKLQGTTLRKGTDYQVLYNGSTKAPTKAGSYKVTIMGAGAYMGTKSVGTMRIYSAAKVKSSTRYQIVSAANKSLALDAAKSKPKSGANVSVYKSHKGYNQRWYVKLGSDGYYTITNAANKSLVLDAAGTSPLSRSNVSAFKYNKGANQKWVLKPSGSGYVFVNAANSSLVLDAARTKPKSGTNVHVYSAHGGSNQKWYLK